MPVAIAAVAAGLDRWRQTQVVLDPVMVATSGDRLLAPEAIDALKRELFPRALVITPNLPEAAALLDAPLAQNEDEMRAQARALLALGANAVLIKGGHAQRRGERRPPGRRATRSRGSTAEQIDTKNTHGTGCTLSSAIAAGLAKGLRLAEAVRATPRPMSPPRSPPPTSSASATATARCIISMPGGERGARMTKLTRRTLARAGRARRRSARRALRRARADQALAHGHLLAEAPARPRHVGRARRRAHRGALRRPAADHRVGRGRSGARLRGARRGRRRRRRDGPHRLVLLAGQAAGRRVLHHRAVRADAGRARRLGRGRRRAGAVGRALRAVRRQAVHGRQHRRLHGRLVPPRAASRSTTCAA